MVHVPIWKPVLQRESYVSAPLVADIEDHKCGLKLY